MTIKEFSALLTAIVLTSGAIYYTFLIRKREVRPALASWIILSVAFALSYATYWDSPKHSITGNIANLVALANVVCISAVLIWTLWKDELLHLEFTPWQTGCLVASGLIFVFWQVTDKAMLAFLLVQSMLVVAYIPTVQKIWGMEENTDSTIMWGSVFAGSIIGLAPAVLAGDELGILNVCRSIPSSGFTFWMMFRLDRRAKKQLRSA